MFRVNRNPVPALGPADCYALVDQFHCDPDDNVGNTVAVSTLDGIELRQLLKVGPVFFTLTPGGNDAQEIRCTGVGSIRGKVLKIMIDQSSIGRSQERGDG